MGLVTAFAMAFAMACAQPQAPAPVAPQPKVTPATLQDKDWGRFRSQRQGLSLPLPQGKLWRIDDRSSQWLEAVHPSTNSRVRARTWSEPKVVSPSHCEAEARRFAPDLPAADEGTFEDYVTEGLFASDILSHVLVGVDPKPGTEALEGYVMAFGAGGRRCVVLVYTSQADGPRGALIMGERLELGMRIVETTIYLSRMPSGPMEPLLLPLR